ncbi:hypothetical protein QKR10_gp3 [Oberland virus]|uniref:Uncharacterized protein n=1 Tax=Oberland virus TaxID=2675849 RepID=A0A974MYC3_9MONO|nr:hypothetical protein QKR10_gp3 [Oberland virus]QOI11495.1 hypothetical protein [Oberland virus]
MSQGSKDTTTPISTRIMGDETLQVLGMLVAGIEKDKVNPKTLAPGFTPRDLSSYSTFGDLFPEVSARALMDTLNTVDVKKAMDAKLKGLDCDFDKLLKAAPSDTRMTDFLVGYGKACSDREKLAHRQPQTGAKNEKGKQETTPPKDPDQKPAEKGQSSTPQPPGEPKTTPISQEKNKDQNPPQGPREKQVQEDPAQKMKEPLPQGPGSLDLKIGSTPEGIADAYSKVAKSLPPLPPLALSQHDTNQGKAEEERAKIVSEALGGSLPAKRYLHEVLLAPEGSPKRGEMHDLGAEIAYQLGLKASEAQSAIEMAVYGSCVEPLVTSGYTDRQKEAWNFWSSGGFTGYFNYITRCTAAASAEHMDESLEEVEKKIDYLAEKILEGKTLEDDGGDGQVGILGCREDIRVLYGEMQSLKATQEKTLSEVRTMRNEVSEVHSVMQRMTALQEGLQGVLVEVAAQLKTASVITEKPQDPRPSASNLAAGLGKGGGLEQKKPLDQGMTSWGNRDDQTGLTGGLLGLGASKSSELLKPLSSGQAGGGPSLLAQIESLAISSSRRDSAFGSTGRSAEEAEEAASGLRGSPYQTPVEGSIKRMYKRF